MKRISSLFVLAAVILTACAAPSQPAAQGGGASLLVSGGSVQKTYTAANLEELPATQAAFKDVQYKGVSASTLLTDAGFDPQTVKAVKAVASDGFTVNYDPAQFLREDFVVAYARADGALAPEDGAFRIVLPGAEGKLNVRMMVEIQVIE